MERFTATVFQFGKNADKTGWSYIEVPVDVAEKLRPGSRKSFRVKGKLDNYPIKSVAVMPMTNGNFILPVNADMRKGTGKKKGAMLSVQLSLDTTPLPMPPGFMECLEDEPAALSFFEQLKSSHRNYFLKWMMGVKGEELRAKRIAQVITALCAKQDFAIMIRSIKFKKDN